MIMLFLDIGGIFMVKLNFQNQGEGAFSKDQGDDF